MIEQKTSQRQPDRRNFLGTASSALAAIGLASLLNPRQTQGSALSGALQPNLLTGPDIDQLRHFAPKAERVIYLFQSGGPPHHDLFDYKPHLEKVHGQETPESIINGQRLTGMTAGQSSFPVASSIFKFKQHGQSGAWISEVMPNLAKVADELCFIKSMHTDAINHDPAITFMQTGFQIAGRPSIGSWMSYGLGSENENLPAFVAMLSGSGGQPLYDRLWGSGFLSSVHQGVRFRSGNDPVLFLNNPSGFSSSLRRKTLDHLGKLNQLRLDAVGDPEIAARIAQYEMAYRMQSSVPELTDVSDEPASTFDLYGTAAKRSGTYASNALIARRLAERGVRFVQLFHRGWDTHGGLPGQVRARCRDTDQATAALITDLKQRGLLDTTLVIWGGEFGRTVYCQDALTAKNYGRDHHPRCFTMWMAGGGIKPGMTYGATDDYGYNIAENPVSVHDLHATILNQLGMDHERLTYKFQGRHYRLTDVHGKVLRDLI